MCKHQEWVGGVQTVVAEAKARAHCQAARSMSCPGCGFENPAGMTIGRSDLVEPPQDDASECLRHRGKSSLTSGHAMNTSGRAHLEPAPGGATDGA